MGASPGWVGFPRQAYPTPVLGFPRVTSSTETLAARR